MNKQQINSGSGRRWLGLVILLLGIGILLRRLNLDIIPSWLLTWPFGLTLLGTVLLVKDRFESTTPYLLLVVGIFFLIKDNIGFPPDLARYIWPSLLIAIGAILLIKPGSRNQQKYGNTEILGEFDTRDEKDMIDLTSLFCGSKKSVLSKHFKGGEITTIFGGTELNLMQSDFEQEAIIDLTVVFGGVKLLVPNNWEVKSSMMSIAAGLEDKRPIGAISINPDKTLYLKGTLLFGGVEIKSY